MTLVAKVLEGATAWLGAQLRTVAPGAAGTRLSMNSTWKLYGFGVTVHELIVPECVYAALRVM